MDWRERADDRNEAIREAGRARDASLWTALPGVIVSFNAALQTCVVQPTIQATQTAPNGSKALVTLPLLLDVPVVFPGGGGLTLTFPVSAGDECLVTFAARCIDGWWYSGGVQAPLHPRMHNLSDGFAHVGVRSRPRALSGVSTTSAQLRSDDGALSIDLNPATGKVTMTCTELHVTGAITAVGDVTAGTVSLKHHLHSGVATGGNNSGQPVP